MNSQCKLTVLALAGSLRRESFNRRLVKAAVIRAPAGVIVSPYENLDTVPLFSEDLETQGVPEPVLRLREAVRCSDAVLISTPEYNQSLPGVVKNAVDWLSRGDPNVLSGRPVGILGITAGLWGTRFAQSMLRHTLTACGALVMPQPQLYLADGGRVFAADGALADERVGAQLGEFLVSLRDWAFRLGARADGRPG